MQYPLLPPVSETPALPLPHFPNRFYAAVFRLYETVSEERLAKALGTTAETVRSAAAAMGLPPQRSTDSWETRGYITTIRNAWHLLPYDQLLILLGRTEEELAALLKDEDFLIVKLGAKPFCEPVRYTPPTAEEQRLLDGIRETVTGITPDLFSGVPPFAFFEDAPTDRDGAPTEKADGLRLIYSYCGLYANVLDADVALSYPDALLASYRAAGINAVWLPVVLYQLVPFPFDESYSEGWEKRQERLRTLIARANGYGIKVYLYLNEPRSMPLPFFEKHPELYGRTEGMYGSLCTGVPAVLDYLRYAVRTLCTAVRGIGGFFAITCSENLTHCKSRRADVPCPRCADTPVYKLVSDVLIAISEESRAVDPSIRTVAWTWAWESFMPMEDLRRCIELLPKEIVILCNSEVRKPFTIGGVSGKVSDYSMSIPGPAPLAREIWSYARETGHEVAAKVQVNVTWECSTLPFLPVFDLIREHMAGLRETGVGHLMLSWTLGGCPSPNLKIASDALEDPSEERYRAFLRAEYGAYAESVEQAARIFSDAFREFPFHINTLYNGPQNAGPSTLLYKEPTGFRSTMTGYAFDDLDAWRSIYPRDVFVGQLRLLSEKWREGLALVESMPENDFKETAYGGYVLFRSSYLQSHFIALRDGGASAAELLPIVKEERELALLMYSLMQKNARFGYEAANHYYFSKAQLLEKVLCCDGLIRRYSGV